MEDDAMVKIMQSLDLDYSKAIISTIKFEKVVTDLQTQLMTLRVTAGQTAKDINASFVAELSRLRASGFGQTVKDMVQPKTIFDQFGQPLKVIGQEAQKAGKSVGSMAGAFAGSSVAAKKHGEAVQDVASKYNILGSQLSRKTSWFLAGSAFYGGITAGKETIQTISEVEMGITQIARVTNDAIFNFKDMRDQLLQLGVDYGTAFDKVQDIALRWTQAGYNVKDTIELTKTALLAMNTAELNSEQSTVGFIAIMSQWGLQAKDLLPTLDKINKVGDDFAVTSQDLVDGLTRASGAAKVMGLSLDQTIDILTTMREASGRTGKEVGKLVAPDKSNFVRKHVLNSGKVQRWTIVSQAA